MWPLSSAASPTSRFISSVVAVCSSTAAAMTFWVSAMRPTMAVISSMADTAAPVSSRTAASWAVIDEVAVAVSNASSLTSLATMAKPLPASPARAASMVALRASRLVCSAMEPMASAMAAISAVVVDNRPTAASVRRATSTAWAATMAAVDAFWAISRMDTPSSALPCDTWATAALT
ncbi:MAG: hypothetical protein R2755_09075 [Acidimicrobiales bacterium]